MKNLTIDIMQIVAVIAGIVLCLLGEVSWWTFALVVMFTFHAPFGIGR